MPDNERVNGSHFLNIWNPLYLTYIVPALSNPLHYHLLFQMFTVSWCTLPN